MCRRVREIQRFAFLANLEGSLHSWCVPPEVPLFAFALCFHALYREPYAPKYTTKFIFIYFLENRISQIGTEKAVESFREREKSASSVRGIQTFGDLISRQAGCRIRGKSEVILVPSLRGILVTKFECCSRTDAYSRTRAAQGRCPSCPLPPRSKFRSFRCLAAVFSVKSGRSVAVSFEVQPCEHWLSRALFHFARFDREFLSPLDSSLVLSLFACKRPRFRPETTNSIISPRRRSGKKQALI